jgi:hypothetical protein
MADYDPNNTRRASKVSDVRGELRIDQYLTNFSEMYRQEQRHFVAGVASTPVPVQHESDKYAIYPRGYFWRDEAEVRPLGGRPVQVNYKVESGQYLAEEWGLEHTIDDRQRVNTSTPFDLDESGVMLLEGKMIIREERIWAQKFFGAGIWSHDLSSSAGDFIPFDDAASDPVETIDEYKNVFLQRTGMMPNTIILGSNVQPKLRSNPNVIDRLKYTQLGVANVETLATLFEVDTVRTARGIYNAANEGADDDLEFIADPNGMLMLYIEPTARMDAPTAIARFGWTGLLGGAANSVGGVIVRGRDDRARSDWIQTASAFDYKQVSADLGVWFGEAVSPLSN